MLSKGHSVRMQRVNIATDFQCLLLFPPQKHSLEIPGTADNRPSPTEAATETPSI